MRDDIVRSQNTSPASPQGITDILRRGNDTIDGMAFDDRGALNVKRPAQFGLNGSS